MSKSNPVGMPLAMNLAAAASRQKASTEGKMPIPVIRVSETGDDETGDGTAEKPLRTEAELRKRQRDGRIPQQIGVVLFDQPMKIEGFRRQNRKQMRNGGRSVRSNDKKESRKHEKKSAARPWRERQSQHMKEESAES